MAAEVSRDRNADIAALATGALFHGAYEVVRCIKAGGMGAVYEVLQKNTERRRALKVMLPSLVSDPEMRQRFELEAKVAAGIESEHIVETLDAGVDEATGMPFIVMELLKGEELGALLKARRRLPPDEVITLLHQAALALDRTHAAGIVHRDLKPENLYLTRRDDGSPRLKILDFGVAKIVHDGTANSNTTKSVGSPLYMAPEQIAGDPIGPHVDRYSLAHIAFTMLVGKPYWARERKSAQGLYPYLMLVARGAQTPASERARELGVSLPPAFDTWFSKATALSPSDRFDGAAAQIEGLAEAFTLKTPATTIVPVARGVLPSIVLESVREVPLSIPPPSDAMLTAPGTPVSAHVAAMEKGPSPAHVPSSPPPSDANAEPSTSAFTRTSAHSLTSSAETPGKRRSSVSPVLAVLLLAAGVAAVGGALVFWPKAAPFATSPTSSPTPTSVPTASAPAPAAVLPAALSTADAPAFPSPDAASSASSASPGLTAEPLTSASALPSAGPLPWDKPTAPSGSSSGKLPFGGTGTSKKTPKGKNPLDEY